jgi:hypothetical protein
MTLTPQRIFTCAIFVMLLLLWAVYAHYFNPPIFPFDDGYIYLHNAQVLHLGYDPNYPGVPALAGSTSPIYLLLVSLLLFILSPLWALQTAVWLGILCYALGLIKLAFNYSASLLQTFCFLLIGLTLSTIPFHLLNGLETGWALAGMVWLLAYMNQPQHRLIRNLLCGSLPYLRPELIIFSSLFLLWEAYQHQKTTTSFRQFIKQWSVDIGIAISAALPWLIWLWLNTGSIVSTSMLAKHAFYLSNAYDLTTSFYYFIFILLSFIQTMGFINFVGMLTLGTLTPNGRWAIIVLALFLFINFTYMPATSGANNVRYLQIYLPLLLFCLITAIKHQQTLIRYGANILLIITTLSSLVFFPNHWQFYVQRTQSTTMQLAHISNWCAQNLPPRAVLLINDAGYISFTTSFHLIDLVGLKSPNIIHYYQAVKTTDPQIRHATVIAAIIRDQHPQYLILPTLAEQTLNLTQHLEPLGWHLQSIRNDTSDGYYVYKIVALKSTNKTK